jgi:simple sugar transport system ATP-binding protein
VLEARGVVKRYGHVEALRGVDFQVYENEVVGLIGDNGAGKSTLVKVLAGNIPPTQGAVLIGGEIVELESPHDARARGIETVYQDLALAPDLDAAANLYLGRELLRKRLLGRLGVLDNRAMRAQANDAFASLGVAIPSLRRRVVDLSGGQRQGIAVARSVTWASRVVLMDEPTAALGVMQTRQVLELIRRVRDSGKSVVLISHNLPDVTSVADRIEVLRLGQRVARFGAGEASMEDLVAAMTGALTQGNNQP